jgi:mono/diheme cytochrome c family protein
MIAAAFIRSLFVYAALESLCAAENAPDFARDILPMLEKRCYECHGEKKQKGGLRFDRKASMLKGGESGERLLVAGKSGESAFVKRVLSTDDDEKMPPKGERLSGEQIEKLKAWIDAGAVIPDGVLPEEKKHWAYEKPIARPLPETKSPIRNGIDAWIFARLDREGLKPSPEADRALLLRRVSLDLSGLPPTLAEVDAFLSDTSPDAYEKAVDRLLASPAYGERWARPWLDLARYADTQGYEKDNRRSMWPWRDWVIGALNRDLPFDQFTIEQIAGDLLPNATQEQKIATGFHRNTMTNTEGGTDNEEFRYEALIDRINTTFGAWMGTTFNCAQCHNHKYDPFTAKEYFEVMAFLNHTADSDKDDESPTMKVFSPGQREELDRLRAAQSEAEKQANALVASDEFAKAQAEWEKNAAPAEWIALDPIEAASDGDVKLLKAGNNALLATGPNPPKASYTITLKTAVKGITGLRLEALADDALPRKGPGRSADGNIILTEFKATANGQPIKFTGARADFQQDGWPVAAAIDGNIETGWAWAPKFGEPHEAVFRTEQPVGDGREVTLVLRLEHTNSQWKEHVLGKFRISVTASPNVDAPALPDEVKKILLTAANQRDDKQNARLREHYRSIFPELKPLADAAAAAKKAADNFERALPLTSVMVELDKPRVTKRHIRGAYLSTAEEVQPATPEVLHPFPAGAPRSRLGFARWLVARDNPLTARVIVNRIWEQYFGRGIVETVEEFGKQGEPPSHPELLDWLAVQFMDGSGSGAPWSMKALHRLVVTSATYRQSSRVAPELRERDPFNRLLARGPRVRLEAEMVRDQALAVSGLLSRKIGGPSVMPPQPAGIWQIVYSGDEWKTSPGEDKYRRGLYTFWRRSSPHPMLVAFDAPSREFCVLRRNRSNTPLQGLNTLNDPAFVEAAQALARKIAATGSDAKSRATFAFRTVLARVPKPEEIDRITKLFEGELAHYISDPAAAEKMSSSELGKPADGANLAELAAWTVVANVLLNLDEAITKG